MKMEDIGLKIGSGLKIGLMNHSDYGHHNKNENLPR